MTHELTKKKSTFIGFLFENSLFLIAGAVIALVWANMDPDTPDRQGSYNVFVHKDLLGGSHDDHHKVDLSTDSDGAASHQDGHDEHAEEGLATDGNHAREADHDDKAHSAADGADHGKHQAASKSGSHGLTIHYLVTDILMALFFAIAGKEVWESFLPGGALSNPRKAATPLLATVGGIVGPAGLYLAGAAMFGSMDTLGRGWAIPCATDIAFSYLVARFIFGAGHPAIAFLLLLAIADDAAGLIILAVFYPNPDQPLNLWWLLLTAAAVTMGFGFRKLRLHSFWWYLLIPGVLSWISFAKAGIHPALGLVPIIPCMPHAHTDLGIFAREELGRHDTLNEFEHWWKKPVEMILGMFALVNAGVPFSNVGVGTYLVLVGLLIGKPLGITLFTLFAEKVLKFEIPAGMSYRHVLVLGVVAGIGFTVALFVSIAAFPAGSVPSAVSDSVKMGALGSFFAAVLAFVVARLLGVRATGAELPTDKIATE